MENEPGAQVVDLSAPLAPLQVIGIARDAGGPSQGNGLLLAFNRAPTDDEMRALHDLPPSFIVAADARQFYDRATLSELAVRLFRVLILGGLVIEETPAAMDWLRDWIDGSVRGHGPIGCPMVWPDRLPTIVGLLREWGYMAVQGEQGPPYVARNPQALQTMKAAVADKAQALPESGPADRLRVAASALQMAAQRCAQAGEHELARDLRARSTELTSKAARASAPKEGQA